MSASTSPLTFRPYEDRDEEEFYGVYSLTYNNGLEVPPERRRNKHGGRYIAELDGHIAGVFSTVDMRTTRGLADYDCAGVAGVGVSPDLRRAGVGVAMMRWSVRHFRESGKVLAALYAFREPFYAKSGYAVCGKRVRVSVPVHRLPKVTSSLKVRRLTPTDWPKLHECHTRFAHVRSGVNVRSELNWERVLAEIKSLTIYAAGDPIEGYISVSHQVAFWEEQWLSEVSWCSLEGYRSCIAMMQQIGINKTAVAWYEPSDSPYYANFLDQGVTTELQRPVMFRVCDVVRGLEGLKTDHSGHFTLAVNDSEIPENRGPFEVNFHPDEVQVKRVDIQTPDLEFEIGTFSQAFLGDPSLSELSQFGSVKVNRQEGLSAAVLLLPHLPVYCSDFF